MPANRLDSAKQTEEPPRNGQSQNGAAHPASGGGFKSWLPLLANLILMPAIAYALTTYVLIPKLGGVAQAAAGAEAGEVDAGSHSAAPAGPGSKITANLGGKVLVNVAGTMGTRYLVANLTLVGKTPTFKLKVEENDAQLRDIAAGILAAKTISDLEKPGMRNMIRLELASAFNDILGPDAVSEIYLTEFAVQ